MTVNSRGQLLGDGDDDDELLAEVARRYYLDNTSKVDIAKQLDLSRFKVARLLEDARSRGIVQIQIKNPSPIDRGLSDQLADALGLPRCVVAHTSGSPEQVRDQVAEAAARTVAPLVRDGDLLGLTWSRAVDAMVDHLDALPACTVIQMAGSLHSPAGGGSTMDLARRAAALAGGTAHAVHAPLVVDDVAAVTALRRQPGIADTLALADGLDISVVAIGAWRAGCSTVWDAVSEELRAQGRAGGAIAEVSGHLARPGRQTGPVTVGADDHRGLVRPAPPPGGTGRTGRGVPSRPGGDRRGPGRSGQHPGDDDRPRPRSTADCLPPRGI